MIPNAACALAARLSRIDRLQAASKPPSRYTHLTGKCENNFIRLANDIDHNIAAVRHAKFIGRIVDCQST